MDSTERLGLPLLVPGQAQKELFHNEALMIADALIGAAVEEGARDDPPESPVPGSCYIVGSAPAADWSGYADHLACYTSSGWRFVLPVDGLAVLDKSDGTTIRYWAGAWQAGTIRGSSIVVDGQQVVGSRAAAIAEPAGGTAIDTEARVAIGEIIGALRQHGLIDS